MNRTIIASLIFTVAFVSLWQVVVSFELVSPAALATPREVIEALPRVFGSDTNNPVTTGNREDVRSTIWRSLLAFLISVPFGIAAGVLIVRSGSYGTPARFTMDFLGSIPATAVVS